MEWDGQNGRRVPLRAVGVAASHPMAQAAGDGGEQPLDDLRRLLAQPQD